MKYLPKLLILFSGIILAHGCSRPGLFNQNQQIIDINHMRAWRADGKIAIIQEHSSTTTNFRWHQDHEKIKIDFINSLGLGSAHLMGTYRQFTLKLADGQIIHASDGEQLIAEKLGLKIPLASLHYWLRGLHDPRLPIISQHRNSDFLLTKLTQSNWQLSYASYKEYNRVYLPCKIYLTNEKMRIKIFILDWYNN